MTVTTTTTFEPPQDGDGLSLTFNFGFRVEDGAGDVRCAIFNADGVSRVPAFTSSGGPVGGSVTITAPSVAPAVGEKVLIWRSTTLKQNTNYSGGNFPSVVHEMNMDRLFMAMQEAVEDASRTLRFDRLTPAISPLPPIAVDRVLVRTAEGFGEGPDIAEILSAGASASTARDEAVAAKGAAATSETNAANSASAAAASQAGAASLEAGVTASASAAATSEANAAASATSAGGSATAAASSETIAANSASSANGSASAAASSASAAATSETNAANSATAAATSEANCATSEANAAASAAAAATFDPAAYLPNAGGTLTGWLNSTTGATWGNNLWVETTDPAKDTKIHFRRSDTGAMGWIGIPYWDLDALYFYGPTANGAQIAGRYALGAWSLYAGGTERFRIEADGKTRVLAGLEANGHLTGTMTASLAEAEAGTVNTKIMTPLRTKEAVEALTLGVDQTWQDVSGSRTQNTSYQNTTGRPIGVAVTTSNGGSVYASADGVTWLDLSWAYYGSLVVVPDGWFYKTSNHSIISWKELR